MKALIVSDIHGSASATEKALAYFESFHCDYLFLLEICFYHGPRNVLPLGQVTIEVVDNPMKKSLLPVDRIRKILQSLYLFLYGRLCSCFDEPLLFLTHGHLWEPALFPKSKTDAILSGHTHRPSLQFNVNGVLCFNPGSISLPRGEFAPTFGFYNQGEFSLHLLEQGEEIAKMAFPTK